MRGSLTHETDCFWLGAFDENNNREDVVRNMYRFAEGHFTAQVDAVKWPMEYIEAVDDMRRAFDSLGLLLSEEAYNDANNNVSEFIRNINLDEIQLDLQQVVGALFIAIYDESPDYTVVLDSTDPLKWPRSITFKAYHQTFDREDFLQNQDFIDFLKIRCMTALFEIRYIHLQRKSKDGLDKLEIPTS